MKNLKYKDPMICIISKVVFFSHVALYIYGYLSNGFNFDILHNLTGKSIQCHHLGFRKDLENAADVTKVSFACI